MLFEEDLADIFEAFHGKLVGTHPLQHFVCEVVKELPEDMQGYITTYCWFVGSLEDAWAYTFTGNDLSDQHLVFLSDELFAQDPKQIRYSIAHEIGHIVLGHRNSIYYKQTKQEIDKQEKEADAFARQYFPTP